MKRILVAGGAGNLGSSIVKELERRAQKVRILSRKPAPQAIGRTLEWARADVITGDGLEAALQGVEVIVNCLTSPRKDTYETDVAGTRRLLAKANGVERVVHISIVGIDRIIYPYYQYKLGAELAVLESGVPYTIARCTQFHSFLDFLLSPLREVTAEEIAIPVDLQFQPISTADVASHLAPHIIGGDTIGRLTDFGGPEVLKLGDMAAAWLDMQQIKRAIKPATASRTDLPYFNSFADWFLKGYNTNPDNPVGDTTWGDYLRQTYRSQP